MANPIDVIKSYLVNIGFSTDLNTYQKSKEVLKNMEDYVTARTSGMARSYALASTSIVGSLAAIGGAIIGTLDKVAQADLGYQKFALRMYMATDAAKQFKIVTDSMGESLQDIAWIPELNQRYKQLMGEARGMETPKDAGSQLRYLRDIRFEFTRLKVEATYGLQWVGYYLFKYLMNPITGARFGMKELNDWIQKKMPEWAEKVAKFLYEIIDLGKTSWRAITDLTTAFTGLFNQFPGWLKIFSVFAAGILFFVTRGPIGKAIIILGALPLLIDDFYAKIEGRESSTTLSPIWDVLIMSVDTLVRLFVVGAVAADRFYNTIRRTKSAGQLRGLSVVDEIKEVWEASGILQKGGPLDKKRERYQNEKSSSYSSYIDEANRVERETGVPAHFAYGHWYHETGGFKNRGARELNNPAGINIPGGKGSDYKKYESKREGANDYIWLLNHRYKDAKNAKDVYEYMAALKKGGYFTGPLEDAQKGAAYGARQFPGLGVGAAGGNQSSVTNNQFTINLPIGTTDEQIRKMQVVIDDAMRKAEAKAGIVWNRKDAITP